MKVELQEITKQFGELTAVEDVSLTIEDGEFVTLVGPSGCGKTTTLRMIAGLEVPTEGHIKFGDVDVTNKIPQEREIAFVFQDYALYPHMTARRNLSFALGDGGLSKEEINHKIEETASMLGIAEHLDKKPASLSGGQQQRVALGRSIVRDPDIFLLDEPLANLDAKLRVQMRAELQQLHQELNTTTIYVTHDQEEAMTMSDRIVILNEGELQQVASPEVAYSQPANRFVAGFIGSPSMNFMSCRLSSGKLDTGTFTLDAPSMVSDTVETPGTLGIRPEDLTLVSPQQGDVTARVSVFEQVGSFNILHLEIEDLSEEVVAQVPGSQHFDPGEMVGVSIDPTRIHLFGEAGDAIYNPPLYSEQRVKQR